MASKHQIRGVLLEEAVLMLLRASGYRTVTDAQGDSTLGTSAAGLTVGGRGAWHQIDAIADLLIGQPFGYPQRLLVEAKSYADNRKIGLPIVRGSVGVLKDVSEYWVANLPNSPPVGRYHYQVAIFSSSDFTKEAQDYAFAHDIHLLPLSGSSFFVPVLQSIEAAADGLPTVGNQVVGVELTPIRRELRRRLQPDIVVENEPLQFDWLGPVVTASRRVSRSLVATLGQAFSIFLTPDPALDLDALQTTEVVHIKFRDFANGRGWTMSRPDETVLFTFDLPPRLFQLYADEGVLTRQTALELKETYFSDVTAVYAIGQEIRLFRFRLNQNWVEELRATLPDQQE